MTALHIGSVTAGLMIGAVVLLREKGTDRHRQLGWAYVVLLLASAVASFGIMELRPGRPSVFHGVSVLVSLVVLAAVVAIRRGSVRLHAILMASSFLATVVTGIAQFFDQLPLGSDTANAIVFLQVPSVVGFALIWRMASRW